MGDENSNGCNYPYPGQLKKYILDCKEEISREKIPFNYPPMDGQSWPEKEIADKFDSEFKHMNGCGNVYAIFECRDNNYEIKYIGTSKKTKLDKRIKQHLVKKPGRTSSKLECVKSSVHSGVCIAISYILVKPDNLRLFVERELIEQIDPPWNKRKG